MSRPPCVRDADPADTPAEAVRLRRTRASRRDAASWHAHHLVMPPIEQRGTGRQLAVTPLDSMTIRRPRTPVPTLRHAVFLEALADRTPYEAEARALTATLLTLRLADEWLRSGAVTLDPSGNSLRATLAADRKS